MDFATLEANVATIAADFAWKRAERQQRRTLDPADFDRLRDAGFPLVAVPREQGGLWHDVRSAVRPICQTLRTLAQGDASVALVASMHPAVLSYWLTSPIVDAAHQIAWDCQRAAVCQTVREGAWWGTITSEPSSGGDITRTKAVAVHDATSGAYRLTGQKHFGSGWGVLTYFVTTAIAAGESHADWFYLDARSSPSAANVIAEWDGHGMTATQSHAVAFRDFPAERFAWPGGLLKIATAAGGFIGCLFSSVIVGIVDAAAETVQEQLHPRRTSLRPFEQVEWARAEQEIWLLRQAFEGMVRAVETQADPRREVLQGKTAIAELAESALTRLCRVVGGGTYSRRSPLGYWLEDVRALGFLRPPWPLAFDQLIGWL